MLNGILVKGVGAIYVDRSAAWLITTVYDGNESVGTHVSMLKDRGDGVDMARVTNMRSLQLADGLPRDECVLVRALNLARCLAP
jgi:hypothetical protein